MEANHRCKRGDQKWPKCKKNGSLFSSPIFQMTIQVQIELNWNPQMSHNQVIQMWNEQVMAKILKRYSLVIQMETLAIIGFFFINMITDCYGKISFPFSKCIYSWKRIAFSVLHKKELLIYIKKLFLNWEHHTKQIRSMLYSSG